MPNIVINIDPLLALADDPLAAAFFLLTHGAWIIFLVLFLWIGKTLWYYHIWDRYVSGSLRPVLLAIDVPKMSIQTPKAVENMFAHLAGAHGSLNRREKHLEGKVQEWFSFEIVSIDGYTQFLVWTWDKFRDLIETMIYAQYPDAQITEVQDYTTEVPQQYPHGEWDLWGTEFVHTKPFPYPTRTWEAFEHQGQKEEAFKDPLAAMLENMARIGPGEQIWLQILVRPISQEWQEKSMKLVKKLIGAKVPTKKTALDSTLEIAGSIIGPIAEQVLGTPSEEEKKKENASMSNILYMSPGERAAVEAIEEKAAKIGFQVKLRLIYAAKKEVFKKQRGAHAVIGAIKQYNMNDLNSLKPEFKTVGPSSLWLFKGRRNNWRKTKLVRAYRSRSMYVGRPVTIMNTEELASYWHFPTAAVHAPLIMRTEGRRGVPPSGLPMADAPVRTTHAGGGGSLPPVGPPPGLPIVS